MFAGSLIVGGVLVAVALWLEYQDSVGAAIMRLERQKRDGKVDESLRCIEARYEKLRRRWRLVIHLLLAGCGGLMMVAGWIGPGRFWVAAWTAIALLMLCVLVLAAGDALRTFNFQNQRLWEARKHWRRGPLASQQRGRSSAGDGR